LVPVIEAWDTTLTEYDEALTVEIERRRLRLQGLDDLRDRISQKQHVNSAAIPLAWTIRRTTNLAKRMSRRTQRREAISEGMDALQEQHGAVQILLNSMIDYTNTALA
jgi:hypothetical protein